MAGGSPEAERFGARLELHRANETNDAEDVVGVEVREEDVAEDEGDPVAHHLALGAFAAIEEERFAFANEGDGRDVAFDGGPRGGGSEEAKGQRHGAADIGRQYSAAYRRSGVALAGGPRVRGTGSE